MFDGLRDWFERRRAFGELRAVEGRPGLGFSNYFSEQIRAAKNAFDHGDRDWAFRTWSDMNRRYPKLSMTSEDALNLLIDLARFDQAELMIHEGRRRHPWHRAIYAAASARIAYGRGDLEEALRRCETVRRKFPRLAAGYTIATVCFAGLDRPDDAEAMIGQAARKFPRDFDIVVAYARHAVRRKDWPEALRRWEDMRNRFDNFLGPLGMAQSLREMGHFAEAKELASKVCEDAPRVPWGYSELADIAAAEGNLTELSLRWEITRSRCPDFVRAYIAGAEAERRLGREQEADAILHLAVTRMRYNIDVHLEYARNADRRGDRQTAIGRWALVRERFPDCEEASEHNHLADTEQETGALNEGSALPSSS